MIVGIHLRGENEDEPVGTVKGNEKMLKLFSKAVNIGCDVVQIFTGNVVNVHRKVLSDEFVNRVRTLMINSGTIIVIHSSLSLNLCLENEFSISGMRNELKNCSKLGAIGVVVHMGIYKTKKYVIDYSDAVLTYTNNVKDILNSYSKGIILLETPAKKTEICYTKELFVEMYNMFTIEERKRIGICIDTAHLWTNGYDIRNKSVIKDIVDYFMEKCGNDSIKLIHYNDSMTMLDSGVDRHDYIGHGYIGNPDMGGSIEGLAWLAKWADKTGVPLVQETKDPDHKTRIVLIKQGL